MTQKPTLSFWQIWNMCFGFLGIQFGFALQNANVSRIFQTLGADIEHIPLLWIAAPVTGLIVQPIIGYFSDHTWGKWGRRRPFFVAGAVLSSIALIFMPNSPSLWIAAGMLWVLDASINISMEPFRAFVGDNLNEKQRPTGYAMQSFFIGIGAVVASALPWIMANWFDISNTAPEGQIPDSVKFAFYWGAAILFIAVMWTVVSSKEYSPEELAEQANTSLVDDLIPTPDSINTLMRWAAFTLVSGTLFTLLIGFLDWKSELYILSASLLATGICMLLSHRMLLAKHNNGFCEVMLDLVNMPTTMKQLAIVQFFSWFALFAMWIYTTSAITSHHYGTTDVSTAAYNEGANWVGVLFAAYNGFTALAAIFIPKLVSTIGIRQTHAINLLIGAFGLSSIYFIEQTNLLLVSMVAIGFAWASILSLPYSMLANALPANKMGVFMGIFNFFIVIPQILAASILGLLINWLADGQAIAALFIGAASLVIAAVMVCKVTLENN